MRIRKTVIVIVSLISLLVLTAAITRASADDTQDNHSIFLPLTMKQISARNEPPAIPSLIAPLEGAVDVDVSWKVLLDWYGNDPDGDIVYYDVYLRTGDDPSEVLLAEDVVYRGEFVALGGVTNYHWRVVADDHRGGITPGPEWSFTTAPCPIEPVINMPVADGYNVTINIDVNEYCAPLTHIVWDWGDGITDTQGFTATHTYAEDNLYAVTATAYNDQGGSGSDSFDLYVGAPAGVCDYILGIPKSECEALAALYEATDGPNWDIYPGWIISPTPCEYVWQGVDCEGEHVDYLYLGNKNLSGDIPPDIGNLTALARLVLSDNSITSIPTEIGQLTQLTSLELNRTLLSELPPEIGNLSSLIVLELDGIGLHDLPEEIWNLTGLKSLSLSGNNLTTLSEDVSNLTKLVWFYLDNNALTSIPEVISGRYLYLQNNELTNLPDTIASSRLRYILDVSGNNLEELPEVLCEDSDLAALYLQDNNLSSLPVSIGTCYNLGALKVHNNQLVTLPLSFYSLSDSLDELTLYNNALTALPDSIGDFEYLLKLNVSGNALTTLPASIGSMPELNVLDVSTNTLTTLPEELGQLTDLQRLRIAYNPTLTGPVPDFLTTMTELETFFFNDTGLCVPASGIVPEWLSGISDVRSTGITCPESTAFELCPVDGG